MIWILMMRMMMMMDMMMTEIPTQIGFNQCTMSGDGDAPWLSGCCDGLSWSGAWQLHHAKHSAPALADATERGRTLDATQLRDYSEVA